MGEGEVGNERRGDVEGVAEDVDLEEVEVLVDGVFEESFEAHHSLRRVSIESSRSAFLVPF